MKCLTFFFALFAFFAAKICFYLEFQGKNIYIRLPSCFKPELGILPPQKQKQYKSNDMMNPQPTLLIFLLNICLLNSAHAGWFDSEKTKKRDRADFIVNECLQILQANADKDKSTEVKIEAYAGDINILSENLVLMKVIFLSSYDSYVSKREKEGVCRYSPDSKSISWKPLLF